MKKECLKGKENQKELLSIKIMRAKTHPPTKEYKIQDIAQKLNYPENKIKYIHRKKFYFVKVGNDKL